MLRVKWGEEDNLRTVEREETDSAEEKTGANLAHNAMITVQGVSGVLPFILNY